MNHLNIKQGFKLLLIAQILMIMCNALGVFIETIAQLRIIDVILAIASSFISIIAINLICKDDRKYTKAYYWAIISLSVVLILFILQQAFIDNKQLAILLEEIEKLLSDICEFVTASIIINTSVNNIRNTCKTDLIEYGEKTHYIHKLGFVAGMILDLIHGILIEYSSLTVTFIGLIAFALLVIADVRYFLFLNKVRNNID